MNRTAVVVIVVLGALFLGVAALAFLFLFSAKITYVEAPKKSLVIQTIEPTLTKSREIPPISTIEPSESPTPVVTQIKRVTSASASTTVILKTSKPTSKTSTVKTLKPEKTKEPPPEPEAKKEQEPEKLDAYAGETVTRKNARKLVTSRAANAPKVGDDAPDFELKVLGKDEKIKLSSFKNKKPVVLVLSSYT